MATLNQQSELRNQDSLASGRTSARYAVLVLLCLSAAVAYFQRNSIAVAEKTIRTELNWTPEEMGWVMSSFFITYALLQVPCGVLVTRYGPRRMLPLFALVFSASAGIFGAGAGMIGMVLARLGMGAGQAGLFPGTTSTVSKWFPRTGWALSNGAIASFMQVGAAVGAAVTGLLLTRLGWKLLFALYALPGLAWAAWFYLWFRDRPEEHPAVGRAELELIRGGSAAVRSDGGPPDAANRTGPPDAATARQTAGTTVSAPLAHSPMPWLTLLSSWAMICICGQQFFRGCASTLFGSWFATYLKETRHVDIAQSGMLTSLPIVALAVGSLAGGGISDWLLARTGSRRVARQLTSVVTLLFCVGLSIAAYWIRDPLIAVLVISAGSFFAAISGPCAYAITIDMGGRHVTNVFSTMNMWGNIGAWLFPLLVPKLVKHTDSWESVLFLFAGIYLAAAFAWMLFDPNRTIFEKQEEAALRAGNL